MILNKETVVSRGWLVFEDEEITVDDMETAVNERITKRRQALGQPAHIEFPTFGYLSPMPELPQNSAVSKTLYHHLRELNKMPPPETTPVLASSPAMSMPLFGRLWSIIREQAHQLVLFYVNRALMYETVVNNHTLNTLNELTRLTQSQQEEIYRLQEEIKRLHEAKNSG